MKMQKEEQYVLIAIVTVPIALMLLSKLYHMLYVFLFPCDAETFRCDSAVLPSLLTLLTGVALISFATYMVFKNKL